MKTPIATRQLRCSPCSLLSINCFCIGQWPAVLGVPEGLCSLGTSEPLPTLSVAAIASTEKSVSRAYSGLLVQSLLSCASCGVLEQHLLAHPYLCLVSCVCVCLLHLCSYDGVSVCVLLAYCVCVCVLHPYLLLRRRVCLCLASLRPCLWCTCERRGRSGWGCPAHRKSP